MNNKNTEKYEKVFKEQIKLILIDKSSDEQDEILKLLMEITDLEEKNQFIPETERTQIKNEIEEMVENVSY
ncbi:hypothetical protein H9M94_00455 [Mycoplasma sp. Pen4]|uniref:hypothetical protein n=1 Tax=Mycoplasma sp. Pen4 TaxID=640330 RepID=UPI00165490C8|nr:hypothetical protein [Mycoplasma sp. Pen4]QNM93735.1 hypothetical protein H9M94_00455 [Mycoplasma sp. Pen4]